MVAVAVSLSQAGRHSGRIDVDVRDVSVATAISTIAEKAGVNILFTTEMLPTARVTYRGSAVPVEAALAEVLRGSGVSYERVDAGVYRLVRTGAAMNRAAAQGTITGKVIHAKTKQAVAGATILLDEATKGITTASDGTFRLTIPPGEHTVHIRALGMIRHSRRVTVKEGESQTIEVTLDPSASVLDEIIVTGTVVATERKAIPNPITVITAEEIERRGITRIEQLLRGSVPGVLALEQGSATYDAWRLGAMDTSKVFARGASRLDGSGTPMKTYVDGVELFDQNFLGSIDPQSIERIEIVTGPQAATIYGSGAMGGVMQIFTKKGFGKATPELTIALKYGMMQSNLSNARTPMHNHMAKAEGGSGPSFSYSVNVSYLYSGQWQPNLFNRRLGASVGVNHVNGRLTASGSASTTMGLNGTANSINGGPLETTLYANGTYFNYSENARYLTLSPVRSRSTSQNTTFNVDYRVTPYWQHGITAGRSQASYSLVPVAPEFGKTSDTLFRVQRSNTIRTTAGYRTSLTLSSFGPLSANISGGFNGSWGDQLAVSGQALTATTASLSNSTVSQGVNNQSVGGFATTQIGLFGQLYLTLGIRGEKNPSYGQEHKIDWTPTNGIAYSIEIGELTAKVLGSYGRATRAPIDLWRLGETWSYGNQIFQRVLPNEKITPEYSRGPQGGIELYYGNLGSLTINRHVQTVTDLVQRVPVDTIPVYLDGEYQFDLDINQFLNVATIKNQGWEATTALNIGPVQVTGTYSWADSRVQKVNTFVWGAPAMGSTFLDMPTHFGGATLSYAHDRTSVTIAMSYIGAAGRTSYSGPLAPIIYFQYQHRLRMYLPTYRAFGIDHRAGGYAKTDLSFQHRIRDNATLTANVINLGSSFGSEGRYGQPTLGRQTLLGFSVRVP